ncbi:GP3 protein [DeBrazza's monkey arterivirus]|uniref:GP3 protein n=1 Tax=DeBrazza's monkey arterivirus TaxID=1965063 RepID=A0A0B6CFJ1_9NIDO|nr:GP3 protein [DeBrazza's monkey arterivirus]AJI43731.1 GP3 protein [DeBrazza's monkey arterivirus]
MGDQLLRCVTPSCGIFLLLLCVLSCASNQTYICLPSFNSSLLLTINASTHSCLFTGNVLVGSQYGLPICPQANERYFDANASGQLELPTGLDLVFLRYVWQHLDQFPSLFNGSKPEQQASCWVINSTQPTSTPSLPQEYLEFWEFQPLPLLLLILVLQLVMLLPPL